MKAIAVLRGRVRDVRDPDRKVLTLTSIGPAIDGTRKHRALADRLTPSEVEIDGVPVRLFGRWLGRGDNKTLSPEDLLGLAGFSCGYVVPEQASGLL